MEEEDTIESSGVTDSGKEAIPRSHSVKNRNYREIASNDSNEGTFSLKIYFPQSYFYVMLFLFLLDHS